MLVLTRRRGEAVVIKTPSGERIKVLFIECKTFNSVRLGFAADRSVEILREEVEGRSAEHSGGLSE